MTIQNIALTDLTPAAINVRKHGAKHVDDLIHSIRAIGLLQPLVVRPNVDGFDVVAGQRRYHALTAIAEDTDLEPIPCVVMASDDDAAAIEASLAENIARKPMDEVDQYKAFARLIKEGRSVVDIAHSFGLTERMVQQRLALGNLHCPILTAYRKGDLDAGTIRNLTLASQKQQKAWWALVKDGEAYAPMGRALKNWLFGGVRIPIENALFDVAASDLAIVSDLFGEEAFFADSDAFWEVQGAVVAKKIEALAADGWQDVQVMERGVHWCLWEHSATAKKDGGRVYVTFSHQGEVTFHEGYLTAKEAQRASKSANGEEAKPVRPELTKAMDNYLSLHRHAAVRRDLLQKRDIALRLVVAHMIVGSSLWSVKSDPQRATKPSIADSLATNTAQQAFEAEQQDVAKLLDFDDDETVLPSTAFGSRPDLQDVLLRLTAMDDTEVMRILTCLMAASLEAASPLVETLAQDFGTDLQAAWSIDDTFFDLLRDKEAINAMVGEIAGDTVAKQHVTSTAKEQKAVIKACLDGSRIANDENWCPRYMSIPMQGFTQRSGFDVVERDQDIAA